MSALCHERLPFNNGKLAMDAALPPPANGGLIGDNTMEQVLDLLRGNIDEQTFKKVQDTLMARSAMSADQSGPIDPENVERAVDLLRTLGIGEKDIAEVYKLCGVERPTQAQDSARRERISERQARSYNERFPGTGRIGGDAKISRSTDAAKSYAERFPDAARIKFA